MKPWSIEHPIVAHSLNVIVRLLVVFTVGIAAAATKASQNQLPMRTTFKGPTPPSGFSLSSR